MSHLLTLNKRKSKKTTTKLQVHWCSHESNASIKLLRLSTSYHSQCEDFESRSEKLGDLGNVSGRISGGGKGLYWRIGLAT